MSSNSSPAPPGTGDPDSIVSTAFERLRSAQAARRPGSPVRDLIGSADVELAYAVQQMIVAERLARGAVIVGRKIGLTSPAVQKQLGVNQPDFGVLFDDMSYPDGAAVPLPRLLQPKVEAEIAFVLRHDLDEGPLDSDQVANAVEYAVAAIEIVDSRIMDWDITFNDTVADNASSGLFVLGAQHMALDALDTVAVSMVTTIDGREVSTGNGQACMGDPLNALRWLAQTARRQGSPLRSGQVVLSGALGPMATISGPCAVRTDITGLGSVSATFVKDSRDSIR